MNNKAARFFVLAPVLALCALLAACGGGSSNSSPGSSVIPTTAPTTGGSVAPTPTPTATAAALAITGTVTEYTSGTALSGFTVTVGALPVASTCLAAESNTSMPCGVPASPTYTTTTTATGSFSVNVPAFGTYMLTIGNGTAYATLHRSIIVPSSGLALGTLKVAALTSDEQAWVVDFNNQRATVSVPTSFSNLVVDEYAEEQARKWASDTAAGVTAFTDAGYAPYQSAYSASSGAMYGAAGVLAENLLGQTSAYLLADNGWMAEKANCPSGNWQTCTVAENTGHYINASNTDTVWIGVGESGVSPVTNYTYYDAMLIENGRETGPASVIRVR
jgi:hypothetical protein